MRVPAACREVDRVSIHALPDNFNENRTCATLEMATASPMVKAVTPA
jgi:hypothetical protein|tara:strand:+ start:165 stop:305 length:141 start_codon:yes stop_codon:yes gene_type:complete